MDEIEAVANGWISNSSNCFNWVGITSDFHGVTCNSSSGRIVGLALQKRRLTGNLSDIISNLDQLRTLNLSHNFLEGPLPISLFHLAHLDEVDLSSNKFDGVLPVSINLPALQVLDISDNYINIHNLDLSSNKFDGVLPVSINLPALQVLDISDNAIRGSIPAALCVNSTGIRLLRFAVNYFSGSIPPQLGNCLLLEHLWVASNFLTGEIPEFLFRLPRLRELALQDNAFTSFPGIGNSSSRGFQFSRLVRLDVSSNRLTGNIPDFFHRFPNLSYFSAHSNNLSGELPPSLLNSQAISSLNMRNNSLDGSINFNCSIMVNLTSLHLGTNNFSGSIAHLPSCFKLKAINLARNRLIGQVPESFKNFQSLSFLSLPNCSLNNLSTSLKILQHCPNLTVLVLATNFNTEQLPSDDDLQFKALKALVIPNCRLTGSIPSWLNGLTELQLLDLSWNHLTGSIPTYLGAFKSLFYLDLSNNFLSGEIPKSLTHLPSLISREISLEEPSPDFPFFKKRNISGRGLPLQYNQIMSFPPLLDLSSNILTGPIWPEFGNLKKLHDLGLKHNNLSGGIPSSLSGMRSIETLDLSYNNLSGTIPPSLVRLSFLSKFSVAYNNLRGSIPSGGQFQTFPSSSFEGNQGLCGGGINSDLKCEKTEEFLPTDPTSEEDDDHESSIIWMVAAIGFGTGFLVTVIVLVVVPIIMYAN
ncbi:phytosulfokine receptor 1-like [Cynara cardunculus var. scolymus]|uniref:phytosulfokine receptor 1-like n=1 Tax=Cynara cardunculus var. scolymus TaxID=59895 RepID=UPI000D623DCF|nr:phytosulfokine receptor 1-like [Cynara cardunculus var. scolymus]